MHSDDIIETHIVKGAGMGKFDNTEYSSYGSTLTLAINALNGIMADPTDNEWINVYDPHVLSELSGLTWGEDWDSIQNLDNIKKRELVKAVQARHDALEVEDNFRIYESPLYELAKGVIESKYPTQGAISVSVKELAG